MTTVTGDYEIDFSGLPDTNPYSNVDFTDISTISGSSDRIISGAFVGNGLWALTTLPSATTIRAKIEKEISSAGGGYKQGPAVVDLSGNGYSLQINLDDVYLRTMTSGAIDTGFIARDTSYAYAAGSTFELEVNKTTGDITVYANGVELFSANDTTYTSNDLSAGMVCDQNPGGGGGIISFAADGYAEGSTITTPVTGTNETNIQFTGTDCDTITGASMVVDGVERNTLNITAQTTTTIDLDIDTNAGSATLGVPVDGVPFEPTITAAGITPYSVAVRVTDGSTPSDLGFKVNPAAAYDVIQTTIAEATTTPGESIFGSDIVTVQNDMQARVPKSKGGQSFTWSADGTVIGDTGATVTIDAEIFDPTADSGNGQWSAVQWTINGESPINPSDDTLYKRMRGLTQMGTNGIFFAFTDETRTLAELNGAYFSNKYASSSLTTGDVLLLTGSDGEKWIELAVNGMTVTFVRELTFA